jgi:hypothetical protein
MRVLQEGTRLADRYALVRRLAVGGMSEVWLARDLRGDARVALKLLTGDKVQDPAAKKLLHREWSISSRMMHANIVRVFEFHDEPDGAFFSLQFVGDADLGVATGKDIADTLRPVGLVADALRYAHAKDVVHRDIKAANILLDNRGAPYIIDFGVSSQPAGELRGGGSEIASSPQQLAGEAAQPADDIFALGVLIHELLTGIPPNRGAQAELNVTLLDGSLMPPALQSLLRDMLSYDAASRPDAETVAARLEQAGFASGTLPPRYLGPKAVASEVPESVAAIQPVQRKIAAQPAAAAPGRQAAGASAKLIYGGLGVAFLLLLLVIFVLPNLVDEEPAAVPETEQLAGDDQPQNAIDPEVIEDTPPDPATAGDVAAIKAATDEALGDLLSQMERLRYRAIERWGGQPYLDAIDVYRQGDEAYINKNYQSAGDRYRQASAMLEPFFARIDDVFGETLAAAMEAFARSDPSETVRLYDLAASITPGNRAAEAGLARALNLEAVLTLTSQGRQFETDLELDAAKTAYEKALDLDSAWEPALAGLDRVLIAIKQMSFDMRMTEGLDALAVGDFASARAAFEAAKLLDPTSRQPADGLLQVDQEIKLANIRNLEQQAIALDDDEQWEASVTVYQDILQIDQDLQFAKEGLAAARQRTALHASLQGLIDQPDNLSDPANIQAATAILLDVARISPRGPRIEEQKNELSRLLKRAATPLQVQLVSDNATSVAVLKIGRLGTFSSQEMTLRPGVYVAVGNRPGFRDVRVEFRVAPEIEMQPVVVKCEEQI